jgi:ribonuclease BN (tRNA processing enzyme)
MPAQSRLDLAFLGSGNAFAPGRCWSGFLLNGRYLFDAPPTALLSLKRLGVDLSSIDTVLLTHFHADHFFGLPFLLLEYSYQTQRHSDLTIVGPPGVQERVERLVELGYPNLLSRDSGYRRRYIEVQDGAEEVVNGLHFNSVEVIHGTGLQCFGFRTYVDGRRLSYTGDTTWCDGLLRLGEDVELLVTDCTYAEGRNQPEHLSFEEIRDLRGRIDPQTQLILTHLGGPQTDGGLPHVSVASDLARFSF